MSRKNEHKGKGGIEAKIFQKYPDLKPLQVEETEYFTRFTSKYEKNSNWSKPNNKELKSFIPGTITNIFVKPGQDVKHGDKLVIFEAMKMLNQVIAPFDGKIKEVNVHVGDKVTKGFKMVEFE